MKIGDEVLIQGYIDEIRNDVVIIRNEGGYFGTVKSEIKSDVLDNIRAEIESDWQLKKYPSSPFSCGLRRAIEIIDKYKAESEG